MKNIIWTKPNCLYCSQAKEMLDEEGVEYEVRLVDEVNWTNDDMLKMAPNELTYPQIFLGEKHVGGCDDLEAYLMLREMGIDT
ncbi:MAG: glutaredoxin [Candidatus Thioglobus sp.]|uniref:glutaredoxin n=1 Tax=Candidatus Thioglobus sp. TaxID=2026721 RepID=UPI002615DBAE|nr:glutaredoxin [Candidatus Thioglobus sp.]MDC9727037.1 glutaredoxin [Candidatus Thioglobus sp.]